MHQEKGCDRQVIGMGNHRRLRLQGRANQGPTQTLSSVWLPLFALSWNSRSRDVTVAATKTRQAAEESRGESACEVFR